MVDINLLPEELREKEEKVKKAAKKIPRVFEIRLTAPAVQPAVPAPKPKIGQGFFTRLFKEKEKPSKTPVVLPPLPVPAPLKISPGEEKIKFSSARIKPEKIKSEGGFALSGDAASVPSPVKILKPAVKIEPLRPPVAAKSALPLEVKKEIAVQAKRPLPPPKKFQFFNWLKSIFSKAKIKKPILPPAGKVAPPARAKIKRIKPKINLIPEELAKHPELDLGKKSAVLFLAVFCTVLLLFFLSEMLKLRQVDVKIKISAVEQKVAILKRNINALANQRTAALKMKDQLSLIENLLNSHLYWTKVFSALEKYTVDEVFYNNFAATEKGDLILSAIGKDYQSVARQLVALQQADDFAENVSVTSASAETDESGKIIAVSFDVALQLRDDIFLIKFEPATP